MTIGEKRIADALEVATMKLEDEDKKSEYTWTSSKAKKSFYNQLKALVEEKCDEINHLVSGCNSPFSYLRIAVIQENLANILEALGVDNEGQENQNRKLCATCKWFAAFEGVCCNGDSEHCADFMWGGNDGCDKWEEKEDGD